jgi:hypothetical protein
MYIFFPLRYDLLIIGNTEEEIEEHHELTINEHRDSMKKKPVDANKQTIKTDL